MRNRHGDFIWYELMTSDPETASAFYRAVIGWTSDKFADPASDYQVFSAGDTPVAGLMHPPAEADSNGAHPSWFGYIGVDDVDATAQRMGKAGGTVHVEPRTIPDVGRFAMLSDPQGAALYVMRGEPDEASAAFAPESSGHCQWNELSTSDPDAALSFYGQQFGWKKGQAMPMDDLGSYQIFQQNGADIGAVMKAQSGMPSAWLFYFGVDDIDAAATAIAANGGQIHHGPADVPDDSRIIVATDPQGAMFGLVGPALNTEARP